MRPQWNRKKVDRRIPLPKYILIHRSCLDSLHLPISRPCSFHPLRPVFIPPCYKYLSRPIKLPLCHCVNNNYCTIKNCSNCHSCMGSNTYLCPYGLKDYQDRNRKDAYDNRTNEESDDINEIVSVNDLNGTNTGTLCEKLTSLEPYSDAYEEEGIERTPVRYSPTNISFTSSDTELNNFIRQQTNQRSPYMNLNKDDIHGSNFSNDQDSKATSLTNHNHINSKSSNFTRFSTPVHTQRDKDETLNNNDVRTVEIPTFPDVCDNANQVPDETNLTGFNDSENSHQDLFYNRFGREPIMRHFRNNSKIAQLDETKSHHRTSIKNNDASNQCCLPPYIQIVTRNSKTNDKEEQIIYPRQSKYKSKTPGFERNENDIPLVDNTSQTIEENQINVLEFMSPHRTSNGEQSRARNSVNSNPIIRASSKKSECCKTSKKYNQKKSQTFLQDLNHNYPQTNTYRQNQSRLIQDRKNPTNYSKKLYLDSNKSNLDSKKSNLNSKKSNLELSDQSYQLNQGSQCCHQGIREISPRKVIERQSEFQINKNFYKKVAHVECACSEKYESNECADTKDIKCKKDVACARHVGSSACASVSCAMNQASGCCCRYPPAFKHFSCVGNIAGSCNCNKNN